MSKKRQATKWLSRFLGFFKIFFKNKQGATGVIIIIGFIFMALGAPLLSDKDPIRDEGLSGRIAAPLWLKYLPTYLGGDPSLSENIYAINSAFDDGIEGWNWTSANNTSVKWNQAFGVQNGSLQVQFRRNETGEPYDSSKLTLYYNFTFPYGTAPQAFTIVTHLLVNGTTQIVTKQIGIVYNYSVTREELFIMPSIKLFLQRHSDGAKWMIWPLAASTNYTKDGKFFDATSGWLKVVISSINSDLRIIAFHDVLDAAEEAFENVPGDYTYGVEITFSDENATRPAETSVYVDQVVFYGSGKAYGLMGTESHGRDLFSQLVYGSRVSLYVGLLSAVISVVIGLMVGLAAGFLGKAVDEVLMRFTDLLLVIPFLPLLLVLVAIFGPTMQNLVIIIGVLGWMGFARVVRAQVLSLRERSFVEAAKAIGAGRTHIMVRHIMPNVMSLVYVTLASSVPGAITAEAALSFLGFYDPTRVSWGRMLNEAQFIGGGALNWWWVVFPGMCIALLAMSFILLGFALDEILNPKLRLRR
jgi:peptide/nickel transport system permease protein